MKHRIMILGTQGEFVQLVKKAKERGYVTIVCDGYPEGPARKYADEAYVIPVTETDRIAELCRNKKVDGIMTSFSDLLLECMVKIASQAGLPCYLKPKQLPWYRDKSVCRETLKKLGLPEPKFCRLPVEVIRHRDQKKAEALTEGMQYPLISKPLDKYGSRGIFRIYDKSELLEKAALAMEFTELPEILLEEYNDGHEFNMMTWVTEGQVYTISIADREKTEFPEVMLPQSTRNVYPSRFLDQVEADARNLLQKYISHTGQREGALSMQFFWTEGKGIQVCEIAARFFGYEHELTDMVYHFNIEDFLLDSLYEKEKAVKKLNAHHIGRPLCYGAALYFHGRQLQIADQSSAWSLAQEENVENAWIFYEEGDRVVEYGPNPYLAFYYIKAASREALDEVSERFFQKMSITDAEGKEIAFRNQLPEYEKKIE